MRFKSLIILSFFLKILLIDFLIFFLLWLNRILVINSKFFGFFISNEFFFGVNSSKVLLILGLGEKHSGFTLNLLTKDVSIANDLIKKYTKKSPISSNILKLLELSKKRLGKN